MCARLILTTTKVEKPVVDDDRDFFATDSYLARGRQGSLPRWQMFEIFRCTNSKKEDAYKDFQLLKFFQFKPSQATFEILVVHSLVIW